MSNSVLKNFEFMLFFVTKDKNTSELLICLVRAFFIPFSASSEDTSK